jgi:hypothetical protein
MNWLKVYNYKQVLVSYLIILIFGIIFHGTILQELGVIVLSPPVALPLMIAIISGVYTGKYCQINLPPLPRPFSVIIKRGILVIFLNVIAIIATYLPVFIFKQNLEFLSVVRNVIVSSFLAITFSTIDLLKNVYWLFPATWLLVTMLFGNGDADTHPLYDFVLNSKCTHFEFNLSIVLLILTIIIFGIRGTSKKITGFITVKS